jgi:aminoglycoside phosphotransferase (APT) family kinase protein
MMYRMPPDIIAGLAGADLAALNIPTEADYVAAYCRRTARPTMSAAEYKFYMTFNFFRVAAIFHGIRGRVARGTAASARAHEQVKAFPKLARLAWSQVTAKAGWN